MSFSYDPALASDVHWVRFLIGDRTQPSYQLHDEEITAVLTEEGNKYLAAARCGRILLSRGGKAVSKAVDGLSISYSDNPQGAYGKYLDGLYERGCELLRTNKPRVFHVL